MICLLLVSAFSVFSASLCCRYVQGVAKSGPLKFFAIFSATVWNFNLKFYGFIY